MASNPIDFPRILIYTPSILAVLHEEGLDLERVSASIALNLDSTVRRYPDGSIQIEGEQSIEAIEQERIRRLEQVSRAFWIKHPLSGEQILGGAFYVSLSPFPLTTIDLSFFGEFVRKYETGCVRVRPVLPVSRPTVEENPIDDLHVTVIFLRRLSKDSRRRFADLVSNWLSSVGGAGIFDEGPIRQISSKIDYYPRCARFKIDASRSGQNTINWLIVSILHFNAVNLVTDVLLVRRNDDGRLLDEVYSQQDPKLIRLPIPIENSVMRSLDTSTGEQSSRSIGIQDEMDKPADSDSHVPLEARSYESQQSELFRILALPDWQLENLETSVYFEEFPAAEERTLFRQSLESWLTLGSLGAFGSSGFHAFGKVTFDEPSASARFWCDVGVTDWDLAFKVLVNLLESWHCQGVTIEAVVLGSRSM